MAFVRVVPASVAELKEKLAKLFENRKHVDSMKVVGLRIEVDLSWTANKMGSTPDFYMPLKTGKTKEASDLVGKFNRGEAPSDTDVSTLFGIIDPSGL